MPVVRRASHRSGQRAGRGIFRYRNCGSFKGSTHTVTFSHARAVMIFGLFTFYLLNLVYQNAVLALWLTSLFVPRRASNTVVMYRMYCNDSKPLLASGMCHHKKSLVAIGVVYSEAKYCPHTFRRLYIRHSRRVSANTSILLCCTSSRGNTNSKYQI